MGEAVDSPQGEGGMDDGLGWSEPVESLLAIISRLFVVSSSKNVLQVGLCSLVDLLPHYTNLLPMYVSVLLGQPEKYRRALLSPESEGGSPDPTEPIGVHRKVWGTTSLLYENVVISNLWPHLDIAKTFARQLEANALEAWEPEHIEVFQSTLPLEFEVDEADEWIDLFGKLKQYIFTALVDARLHIAATQVIKRFWCAPDHMAGKSIEVSKRAFLQALVLLYSKDGAAARVDEAAVLAFLRELRSKEGTPVSMEVTNLIKAFQETHPAEYQHSQLDTVFI